MQFFAQRIYIVNLGIRVLEDIVHVKMPLDGEKVNGKLLHVKRDNVMLVRTTKDVK